MSKPTRGRAYRAQSADRHETLRYVSGVGTAILLVAGVALVAYLLHPPLLNWLWS